MTIIIKHRARLLLCGPLFPNWPLRNACNSAGDRGQSDYFYWDPSTASSPEADVKHGEHFSSEIAICFGGIYFM